MFKQLKSSILKKIFLFIGLALAQNQVCALSAPTKMQGAGIAALAVGGVCGVISLAKFIAFHKELNAEEDEEPYSVGESFSEFLASAEDSMGAKIAAGMAAVGIITGIVLLAVGRNSADPAVKGYDKLISKIQSNQDSEALAKFIEPDSLKKDKPEVYKQGVESCGGDEDKYRKKL